MLRCVSMRVQYCAGYSWRAHVIEIAWRHFNCNIYISIVIYYIPFLDGGCCKAVCKEMDRYLWGLQKDHDERRSVKVCFSHTQLTVKTCTNAQSHKHNTHTQSHHTQTHIHIHTKSHHTHNTSFTHAHNFFIRLWIMIMPALFLYSVYLSRKSLHKNTCFYKESQSCHSAVPHSSFADSSFGMKIRW